MTPDRHKAARELLAFYQEAGVDALLGETPVDRFADAPPAIAAPAPPVPAAEVDRAKPAGAVPRCGILAREP
jgi:uracil-DNA glycosylase